MHQQEQNLQNMHHFSSSSSSSSSLSSSCFSYQFLKGVIQIAISFSVFSLFLHPTFYPCFTSYLSTFSSQMFSFSRDKKYIFLLCNGILVFIAKYSGHMTDTCPPPLPDTTLDHEFMYRAYRLRCLQSDEDEDEDEDKDKDNRTEIKELIMQEEEDVKEKYVIYENIYEVKEEEYDVISNDDDGDDEKEYMMMGDSDVLFYDEKQSYSKVVEDEEEQEAIARMSTEELNRKFDDFIRKMKEDLRIEAQQQLIVF